MLQYIAIYCNKQYIDIFTRCIVLYCSNRYCNISIYCNIVASLINLSDQILFSWSNAKVQKMSDGWP